jgi:pSer/pThr/pTyr-binding forkhead associated (FHA) protein/DNA-directed RNA polymerase subunit RPC12/RpoP
VPGSGSFKCLDCGMQVVLEELDEVPACPGCGGERFRRAPMFEPLTEQQTTAEFTVEVPETEPQWLAEARTEASRKGSGTYLAFEEDGIQLSPLKDGWTRIGRSVTAGMRLDDPTVSRRHAIVVCEGPGEVRVLDDRSLNGVFVNGELTDWGTLADGDELTIGRYKLYLLEI